MMIFSQNRLTRGLTAAAAALMLFTPQVQAEEAHAREIFKAMTDYVEAQQSLSFDIDLSVGVVTTSGQKLTIASSGSVALQRPDRISVKRQGGFASVDVVFDGKTLTVLNRDVASYGQADVPGTVDDLVNRLREDFHRPMPAADLLGTDIEASMIAEVTDVLDLGSGVIRGQECDHLAFRTPDVDWQIWVAQGDKPLPCRFVITSKGVEGAPEYTVEFSGWSNEVSDKDFTFEAPAGATKVEIADVPDLDDVSGIFVVEKGN